MTAQELIAALEDYPPDSVVILSTDAESNNHSTLADHDGGFFLPFTGAYFGYHDKPEYKADYGSDLEDDGIPCVCLWPI